MAHTNRFAWGLVFGLVWLALNGCNLNKIAADQTASLMDEASPALDGFWDYELFGAGTPGAIVQLEAMLAVSPMNEKLALNLAKAYIGYGIGWVENEYEIAYAKGDFDQADHLRQRARLLYLRGRDLALRMMRKRDKGIDKALKGSIEDLNKYLAKVYKNKSSQPALFFAAMGWGAAINMSLDQPDLLADLPIAKALMERAFALDPTYMVGGGYIFLGGFEAAFPPALGGDPEKGKKYFEEGLEKTKRRNHMLLIAYARIYAVNTQNKELYLKLLQEIIDAGDLGNDVRITNKIARVRAERYLAQVDELF